ncbi:Lrp/AsnC family transcriptional regulator [Salinarimonas ramus]|uniref:AsnC family transcriptional regulator n=1 Tax=Salinarimonas ramus TaxID=690164 RepID=A0A917V6D3_9HYPH|nr:Lrp/AsnC family transcriptional regulator [Salinarimonas ramus]GGK43242.1 AsnC family transcriptional regulator [Salinarimonas ramus]
MDDVDRRLVGALRVNPRRKIVELARAIGLSRTATQARLDRLMSSGTIVGFDVVLGSASATDGLPAYALVEYGRGATCRSIVPAIAAIPDVRFCCAMSGKPDLLVEILAADVARLGAIGEEIEAIPGVERVTTHLRLETHLDRRREAV